MARAAAASPRLRLVGVAGYEAALGARHRPDALAVVTAYLQEMRAAVLRLSPLFEADQVLVTAGGSTYFDAVADVLTGDWPAGLAVRTIVRSGAYLTHDDGLYARTSPLRGALLPALQAWAQVVSRPDPGLAVLTMGRRDVSFDQDLPVPLRLADSVVTNSTISTRICGWAAVDTPRSATGSDSASRIRARCSTSGSSSRSSMPTTAWWA